MHSESRRGGISPTSTVPGYLSLFSLAYDHKDEGEQYGVLYSGLTSCTQRFEFKLSGDPEDDSRRVSGSTGISCSTLAPASVMGNPGGETFLGDLSDPDGAAANLGLTMFLWEVHYEDRQGSECFFGVFDLNAWYQAQMPYQVDSQDAISNFFFFCSLAEVSMATIGDPARHHSSSVSRINKLDEGGQCRIVNVGIDVSSISRYQVLGAMNWSVLKRILEGVLTMILQGIEVSGLVRLTLG